MLFRSQWCKDTFYDEWLFDYLRRENYKDALERGIKEMEDYANEHTDLKNGFSDYFRYGSSNKICYHITTGRISPWVVLCCDSGIKFLESLNEEQLTMIFAWIDPDFWNSKFQSFVADQLDAREILSAAGL